MSELVTKEVAFNGDILKAVQDVNRVIWVGIRWVCEGIGLSEDRMKYERKRVQEDLVLSQGVKFHPLGNSNGNKDTLCIQIDYLPLWLAKISITPKMKEETPELVERLVLYQLKAKDALAAAFIPEYMQQNKEDRSLPSNTSKTVSFELPDYTMVFADIERRLETAENKYSFGLRALQEQNSNRFDAVDSQLEQLKQLVQGLADSAANKAPLSETTAVTPADNNKAEGQAISEAAKWKQELLQLMNRLLKQDSRFAHRADVYKYIYDEMRRQYGIVWEQEKKDYRRKFDMPGIVSTIDVVYENETLRSIFYTKLVDLVGNTAQGTIAAAMPALPAGEEISGNAEVPQAADSKEQGKVRKVRLKPLDEQEFQRELEVLAQRLGYGREMNPVICRKIYKHMERHYQVDWQYTLTRYNNKLGKTVTKKDVIFLSSRLGKIFQRSVFDLLNEEGE